jgi:membrane fusion protein, macrolide-specific efflux system
VFNARSSLTTAQNQQRTTKVAGESSITSAKNSLDSARERLTDALHNQSAGKLKDQQTIRNAEAQLASARRALESQRAGNAVKAKPATPDQLASDKASIESAENQLRTARKNLNDTVLKAPVAGIVANLGGNIGDDVSAAGGGAASFLTIANPASLKVNVGFSEADALRLQPGQLAKITMDSSADRAFTGKITSIDATQTIVNNVITYFADVSLIGDTTGLRIGMSGSVEVVVAERSDVLTLSTRAIRGNGTSATLRVVEPATDGAEPVERPVQVQVGLRGDERVEIVGGLKAGDKVVVQSTGAGGLPGGFTPPAGGLGGGGLPR